ncbi:MAG: LUD domain-containing protein [Planctomycetia bacterium]|nr:LUD domain-containing protein [Planctomycetia bacterium]
MGSRELILNSIRSALSDLKDRPSLPEVPEVWPLQGISKDDLLETFGKNLTAVSGEFVCCSDQNDAVEKMAQLLQSLDDANPKTNASENSFEWGIMPRPLTESICHKIEEKYQGKLPNQKTLLKTIFSPENPEEAFPQTLQTLNASFVSAEFLLADTGSAVIRASTAFERQLCYLSPICLIAASKSMLNEHLPQVWNDMKKMMGENGQTSGEFLIMTGPSRTADIEKILVLGVHGPKKVVVFIIDNE